MRLLPLPVFNLVQLMIGVMFKDNILKAEKITLAELQRADIME